MGLLFSLFCDLPFTTSTMCRMTFSAWLSFRRNTKVIIKGFLELTDLLPVPPPNASQVIRSWSTQSACTPGLLKYSTHVVAGSEQPHTGFTEHVLLCMKHIHILGWGQHLKKHFFWTWGFFSCLLPWQQQRGPSERECVSWARRLLLLWTNKLCR